MFLGMTFFQICVYFVVYSIIGWCVEVVFHAVVVGKIINRGFLNGPVCPVYGFGMVLVIGVFKQLPVNAEGQTPVLVIFFAGMLLATATELLAGIFLDKVCHTQWWDYSDKPLNLHGYICAEFSILWGIGAIIVIRFVQPTMAMVPDTMLTAKAAVPIFVVLCVIYAADAILTLLTVRGLNKKLAELDKLSASIRTVSDAMTTVVGGGSMKTAQAVEMGQVKASLAKAEARDAAAELADAAKVKSAEMKAAATEAVSGLAETATAKVSGLAESATAAANSASAKYSAMTARAEQLRQELLDGEFFGTRRILNAFPEMKHHDYNDVLKELQERMKRGKK